MQYLASSNSTFNLSSFLDKGTVQGINQLPHHYLIYLKLMLKLYPFLPLSNLSHANAVIFFGFFIYSILKNLTISKPKNKN